MFIRALIGAMVLHSLVGYLSWSTVVILEAVVAVCGSRGGFSSSYSGYQRPNSGNPASGANAVPISSAPQVSAPTSRLNVMSASEAADSGTCLTGTFIVNSTPAFGLFDTRASNSFVSSSFVSKLASVVPVSRSEHVSVPSVLIVTCSKVHKDVVISISEADFSADLIDFTSFLGFDVDSVGTFYLSMAPRSSVLLA